MVSLGRRELARRFRSLKGFRERYALGVGVVAVTLREDDPLLGMVADFLASRRDLFSSGEIRRLAAADPAERGWDLDELRGRIENAGAHLVPGSFRRVDRTTSEAVGEDGAAGRLVWRLDRYPPAEVHRRLAWARPLWWALAIGDPATLRREFEEWTGRRSDAMATSRMLATLPRTSIPVSSPVLLSRCDERARVYEEVSRSRSPDEERSLAAWIAMALEGRRVFEEPDAGSWWVTVHGRVVAVDGPIVSISGPEAVLLERYLAATILERREAACEALVELLEAPPSERRRRRLLGRMRQLVPERDRLDGDWSDRPANNLLAHWRLVGELKLRPRPGLVAFWRGLAVWDRRSGEGMDLRTAYQRWQAARLADRLVADGRSELMASVAERVVDRLDRPLLEAAESGPAKEERPSAGTSYGLVTFAGAALVVTWLRPADLPALALLGFLALALGWVFRGRS